MRLHMITRSAVFGLFWLASLAAQAATLTPVGSSTSAPIAYPGSNNVVSWLIDGTPDYDQQLVLGHPAGTAFTGPYSIVFDLGGAFDLSGMTLWNNAGYLDNDGEGIKDFDLRFLDGGMSQLAVYSGVAHDGLPPQSFGFSAVGVVYVDLVIKSNHQENSVVPRGYAALYEISFSGVVAAVPEPETYAMLLAGLGLVGFAARRRTV